MGKGSNYPVYVNVTRERKQEMRVGAAKQGVLLAEAVDEALGEWLAKVDRKAQKRRAS